MRRRRTVRRWRSRQPGTAAVVRRPDCILLGEVRGGETSNCSRTIGAMNGLVAPVDAIPVMRSRPPPTQWRRVAAISYHVFAIWRRNVRRSTRSQTVSACWRTLCGGAANSHALDCGSSHRWPDDWADTKLLRRSPVQEAAEGAPTDESRNAVCSGRADGRRADADWSGTRARGDEAGYNWS